MKKPRRPSIWIEGNEALLRSFWDDGLSTSEIGKRLGCSSGSVIGKAWRLGLSSRADLRKCLTEDDRVLLKSMWEDGASGMEISREIGCTEDVVFYWSRKLNLEPHARGARPHLPLEERVDAVGFERVANKIVAPGIEKHLVPLLHFRGHADLGRMHRMWNLTLAMKEIGIEDTADAVKFVNHPKFVHICEPLHKKSSMSLESFFSRLEAKPLVAALEPGLLDYIRGLGKWRFQLTPVSEISHERRHAWWREYAPRARTPEQIAAAQVAKLRPRATELMWPYIAHDPKKTSVGGTDIVAMVNTIVSKAIPEENRADICQDLILAVLEGKYSVDDIRDNPRKHIAAVRDHSPWKYEWVSLDAPIYGTDGLTLGETLS